MLKQLDNSVPPHQRLEEWFISKPTSKAKIFARKKLVEGALKGPWAEEYDNEFLYYDGTIDSGHPKLPAWVNHADRVAAYPPLHQVRELGTTAKSREAYFLFSPITNYGRDLLREHLASISLVVSETAIQGLLEGLGRRIMLTCIDIAEVEIGALFNVSYALQETEAPQLSINLSTYPDLYERYPTFAFIIGHGISQWIEAVKEMTRRLLEDLPQLQEKLFDNCVIHCLDQVSMDTGDIHDDGRSVALLTFNNGNKVAYKPKDLRIAREVQDLFHTINNKAKKKLLHIRTILVGQGYAWEEFIPHRECRAPLDIPLYYERYGSMIRIYELLRARDLWLDNIIANGAWPVVVDLEMVMQPCVAPSQAKNCCEVHAYELIEQASLSTGLISMMFPIDTEEPYEDMGGLTPHRPFRTPFQQPSVIQGDGKKNERVYLKNEVYTPRLGGSIINSRDWIDSVQKGYEEMDDLLEKSLKTDISNWLDQLNPSLPVRAIYRDTWTYQQILNSSCAARHLRSVFHREAYLATLPASLQAIHSHDSNHARIVFSEVAQLRQLDIPYFINEIKDGDIRDSSSKKLGSIFNGSALEKIKTCSDDSMNKSFRRDCLLGALETCHGGKGATTRISVKSEISTLEKIHQISLLLLSWAICLEGEYAWISFTEHPSTKTLVLQSIQATHAGLLKAAISLRKAQLCTGLSSLTPVIKSLRHQVEILRQDIVESLTKSSKKSWFHSLEGELPEINKGMLDLDDLLTMKIPAATTSAATQAINLISSSRIPPRLWLLGDHGVFALLDTLCTQILDQQRHTHS